MTAQHATMPTSWRRRPVTLQLHAGGHAPRPWRARALAALPHAPACKNYFLSLVTSFVRDQVCHVIALWQAKLAERDRTWQIEGWCALRALDMAAALLRTSSKLPTLGARCLHLQLLSLLPKGCVGYLGISNEEEPQLKLVVLEAASGGPSGAQLRSEKELGSAAAAAADPVTTGHIVTADALAELAFPPGFESGTPERIYS